MEVRERRERGRWAHNRGRGPRTASTRPHLLEPFQSLPLLPLRAPGLGQRLSQLLGRRARRPVLCLFLAGAGAFCVEVGVGALQGCLQLLCM